MSVRETGVQRIKLVTRGIAVAGVAGSIAFAGLAKSATDSARASTPKPRPTSPAASPSGKATTPVPSRTTAEPTVTDTQDEPQITTGGS